MNLKEIKELVDLITEKGISEFELERAGVRLKITRRGSLPPLEAPGAELRPLVAHPAPSPPASRAPAVPVTEVPVEPPASAWTEELLVVRSPMVGTFYSAPVQGAPPFVQVGDRVQPGQILCIIEAMKLMNEIEAEVPGEVVKCYTENGQPVEYGEPLFDLRPAVSPKKRG